MITLDEAGRGSSSYSIRPPRRELERFVELAWIERVPEERCGRDRAWRIVPDASAHLIFQARRRADDDGEACGPLSYRLAVVGPRSVYTDIDKSTRRFSLGVRLRPGVLPLLLGIPARELRDRGVALEDAAHRWGCELAERMAEMVEGATDPEPALTHLERSLAARIGHRSDVDRRIVGATKLIERRKGRGTVRDLSEEIGVAPRTLRTTMQEHVGLGPKRVARIRRLYRAIRLLQRSAGADRSSVAHAAGYFDQSHMIREFHSLLGETPERFARRASRAVDPV